MKRCRVFVCFVLSFVFLSVFLPRLPGFAQTAVPEGYTGISDREGLEAVSASPDGKYILLNDIDLSSAPWVPLCTEDAPFTGTFDGNGFTVYAMNVSDQTKACGLFSFLDGATVKNLSVSGSSDGPIAGLLAGKIAGGLVEDCTVRGTVNTSYFGGGLVGQISENGTTVTRCMSDVALNGTGTADSELLLGGFCGGVYGAGTVFSDCEFSGSLTTSGSHLAVGGIAGAAQGSVTFSRCGNEGTLSLKYTDSASVGGIAGRAGSARTDFSDCSFRGEFASQNCGGVLFLGGICGNISALAPVTVSRCVSRGTLVGYGHGDFSESEPRVCTVCNTSLADSGVSSYVGGIGGLVLAQTGSVTLSECISFSYLYGDGTSVILGGIAGVNRSEGSPAVISDCYADGKVICDSPVRGDLFSSLGGIAGQNTGTGRAEIRNCVSFSELYAGYPLLDGAVVGLNTPDFDSEGVAAVTQCYFSAGKREFYATPLSGGQLTDPAAYVGLDFETVWKMDEISGLPHLRMGDGVSSCPAGDIDGNGKVTRYDAVLLSRYFAGNATLTAAQLSRADFNLDGQVNALDSALILRSVS